MKDINEKQLEEVSGGKLLLNKPKLSDYKLEKPKYVALPTDKNDKSAWKSWWNYRKSCISLCVCGKCPRCGGFAGTDGNLCTTCQNWINS